MLIICSEGILVDAEKSEGEIWYAYQTMSIKHNVTFVSMNTIQGEPYLSRHYWVTDTEGTYYRLEWNKLHREIKLNTSYTIHYNDWDWIHKIWEIKKD